VTNTTFPGYLIVFEGIDGSGKTTLTLRILQILRGKELDVIRISEPTNGIYGKMIRENARQGFRFPPDEEKELFMKDRMENVSHAIVPALKEGKIILMDRYYISTMAYQGARGLHPDVIRTENERFAPIPDLLFILDTPVSIGLDRIARKRGDQFDDFEQETYLEKVRALFLGFSFEHMHVIDASQTEDAIEKQILSKIYERLRIGDENT